MAFLRLSQYLPFRWPLDFFDTWQINQETRRAFNNSANGFDAVLGARGSKLQIILNSLFHLEESPKSSMGAI